MKFWLGISHPNWLWRGDLTVPLFPSHRQLRGRKSAYPAAVTEWALDSGGFTELSKPPYRWVTSEAEYVEAVERYMAEIGRLAWAAPQDWMCEPEIIEHTGLTVRDHQERTIASYLSLRDRGPFIPVLQGWTRAEYESHVEQYADAGVDLAALPLVGIGSVCRRGQLAETEELVVALHYAGIKLHAFGLKANGLGKIGWALESSDSQAWSVTARIENIRLDGCTHNQCNNCARYALVWRDEILGYLAQQQPRMFAA